MPNPCKSILLSGALLVGVGIAANADPPPRTSNTVTGPVITEPSGSSQSPSRQIATLPPSNAAPASDSITLPEVTVVAPQPYSIGPRAGSYSIPRTERYPVPPDYEANPALHPYTSGHGPRVSSFGTLRVGHYEVPPDFDSNVAMHPYTSHHGPCPEGANGSGCDRPYGSVIAPSHHYHHH